MSLRELLKEPKGKMIYRRGQIFLLHVFWEAPDITAARILLEALGRCAKATHRDTPCVATYHFRICSLSSAVISQEPKTVREHAQLQAALKKLKFGVPRSAVLADLRRRAIDTYLLDLDQETPLPNHMQQTPVMLEFTELYLDERAFYEHAGSKDYLDAYGEVMQPKLMNRQATVCVGSPTAQIKEKILDPMLKAISQPIPVPFAII
ncbi:hypothetical protein TrVFT333_002444 [Trichoderma virens FT-333]|nr:hypothetical protein TrVFT333_002444 [Trichoderma virens FT-333]